MNTLYFVRFERLGYHDQQHNIVFCLTADSPDLAEHNGWNRIAVAYRADYKLSIVEPICQTPDEVEGFEPV